MKIPGGYILIARKTLESDLMDMSPVAFKIFGWMLLKANWKDGPALARGQLFTTIDEMREVCSYLVGYRKERPSKDQIRSAYEALTKATVITTTKTTRGIVVTVCNYDNYQCAENYESHTESHGEISTKALRSPHYNKRIEEEEKTLVPSADAEGVSALSKAKKAKTTTSAYPDDFEQFWKAIPAAMRRCGKKASLKSWQTARRDGMPTIDAVLAAVASQAPKWTEPKYTPMATTWLNQGRWDIGGGEVVQTDRKAKRRKLWDDIPDEWRGQAAKDFAEVMTEAERAKYLPRAQAV